MEVRRVPKEVWTQRKKTKREIEREDKKKRREVSGRKKKDVGGKIKSMKLMEKKLQGIEDLENNVEKLGE